jgi:inhibitor of cysteine peptidase
MRKVFLAVLAVGLLGACGAGETGDTLTERGTNFALGVGDSFTIRLESNASTGYTWALKTDLPASTVTLVSTTYVEPDSGLVGAPGVQEFVFRATGPGTASIDLWYVRLFDDPLQPADEASFAVTVSG